MTAWERYRDAMAPPDLSYLRYESEAECIRGFEPNVIPSLCQTTEYTRELLTGALEYSPSRIDRIIEVRRRQQELLVRARPPLLNLLIGEGALLQMVGSPAVMTRQLQRVRALDAQEHISIQVVPFGVGGHPGLQGPLTLLDLSAGDMVVYLEGRRSEIVTAEPDRIGPYLNSFRFLADIASDLGKFLPAEETSWPSR